MTATIMKRSAFVAASAAAITSFPNVVRAQTPTKIVLVGAQTLDMTPVFYAISSGMYQKAGLDVTLFPASSGTFATTAVVAGTYQMGKGSCIASLVAHLRGLPLKVVANGGVWDPKTPFYATYFANADWAEANKDAVRRWVQTTYASAAYTNTHNNETAAMVAQYTKIPVETIRKIARGSGSVSSDPSLIQPAIEAAAKYKYIPRDFPAKELYIHK